MNSYGELGFFDFEDFVEELNEEELFCLNGGACAGGGAVTPSTPHYSGSCAGGGAVTSSNSTCGCGYTPFQSCGGGYTSPVTIFKKIIDSISQNWKKQYNYDTGYRCDNWVEEVLNDAGINAARYLKAGKANEKTVQQHIDALLSKGKEGVDYKKILPTSNGTYVVFMDDGKKNGEAVGEHCALLVVKDGVKTIYDNSSGNGGNKVYKTDSNGNIIKDQKGNPVISYYDQGVGSTTVISKDNGKTLDGWCYSTYYYQEVKNY